jgi:hypothetical protein
MGAGEGRLEVANAAPGQLTGLIIVRLWRIQAIAEATHDAIHLH